MQDVPAGRLMRAACALALVVTCAFSPARAQLPWPGQQSEPARGQGGHPRANQHFHPLEPAEPQNPPPSHGGNADFDDQRRTDGHMTPDERRLLRQHIEDAVRELYRR